MSEIDRLSPAVVEPSRDLPATLPRRPSVWSGNPAIALYRILTILAFLTVWEIVVQTRVVNPLFIAAPSGVAVELGDLAEAGQLWSNIFVTLWEAFAGFAASLVLGTGIGFLVGLSPGFSRFLNPFLTMMNSAPRIALAPLFVVWFGIGGTSRIVLVFSYVVFIFLTNTIAGTQSVDKDFLTLVKLLSASRRELITKIVLPSVFPWILAAMRLAFPYAIAGAVVGEMFLGQDGLGYLINAGSGVFNIAQIFAALVAAIVIAYGADQIMAFAERRILRWRP